jgi:hypothetical protein
MWMKNVRLYALAIVPSPQLIGGEERVRAPRVA